MQIQPEDLVKHTTLSYAQNREDLTLAGFFPADYKGFYVDVGANDPYVDSVTKYFYDRGWRGINIEPIKSHFAELQKQRPQDTNLNIGIANKRDTLELREYVEGTGLSTFANHMKEQYQEHPDRDVPTNNYVDYKVDVVTLADVFAEQKVKVIDFLKVDVEGFEYEVLAGNDWKKYRPRVICIESNHIEKDWRPLLKENGYILAYSDGLNGYYIDESQKKHLREFSYVKAIIYREPIVNYLLLPVLARNLDEVNATILGYRKQIMALENEGALKDTQLRQMEQTLDSITPLRRHIKRQIRFWLSRIDRGIARRIRGDADYAPPKVAKDGDNLLQRAASSDAAAFDHYNQSGKERLVYRMYMACRNASVRTLKKIVRKAR